MAFQVEIIPANVHFQAEVKESLLHAALRAGLNVDHGCTHGGCGHCKARLLDGELTQIRYHDFILSDAEKNAGNFLMCCHSARSKLTLEATLANDVADIPLQEITTRIRKIDLVDDNTLRLHLRTPRSKTLRFIAGQHAVLKLDNQLQHELPIASCPCDGLNLEFHLHKDASNAFTDHIFQLKTKSIPIHVSGPCNGITLVENDPSPIVFIAWGTGFASVQSLIENCLSLEFQQQMVFHWIVHEHETHYADGYCRATNDAIDNFHYHPIQTETAAEAIEEIVNWHDDLKQARAYIFAPPAIIDNVLESLSGIGLSLSKVQSDPIVA